MEIIVHNLAWLRKSTKRNSGITKSLIIQGKIIPFGKQIITNFMKVLQKLIISKHFSNIMN